MAVESLDKAQYDSVIEDLLKGTTFADISTRIVAEGVDKTWFDALETEFTWDMLKLRAYQDTYGFAGSTEGWATVALTQITPAPAAALPATFDTEGGEEIIIAGSMFMPGCTVTMGGEPVTILAMTPGTIYGLTPALAAAADNDIVVTSPTDLAGTLTPGPATAKKDPTFVSITPASAPAAGGSRHILVGTKFCPGVTVTI